ncbi:MAG: acetolactate decarboxylase [Planctomycetota bacterium]|nr:acetolactate decarboxylase [Planctomycetota bacterium]
MRLNIKNASVWVLAGWMAFWAFGCARRSDDHDVLFQTSTIFALMEGAYDGEMTIGELKRRGDTGLGTFNALNGEMVVMDGVVYRVAADGKVAVVGDSARTPFAAVTFFEADRTARPKGPTDFRKLTEAIDAILPTKNIPYAVRIAGEFSYVRTRSVPAQRRPYPRLVEVVKNQPTFEFRNVRGDIVGFRLPGYVKGVNVPGYHLHFLTDDKTAGGHVLDLVAEEVKIEIDSCSAIHAAMPQTADFAAADLSRQSAEELEKVEK